MEKEMRSKRKSGRKGWLAALVVLAILVAGMGVYKLKAGRTDADLVLTLAEQGFEGHLYDAGEREKVVITFSGSDGGASGSDALAWYYKQHGISALGVTLFAGQEIGKNLDRVPLEYVENAIAWLKAQGYERIAVDGLSKGSEYALLAASRFEDITCVVARVPSYFVSEGMIGKKGPSGTSCWAYRGEELSYTPYSARKFNVLGQIIAHGEFNILAYNAGKAVTEASIIPMENINGPVLLIATEADTVWPSAEQAAFIEDYLRARDFPHEIKRLTYENVSHFALPLRGKDWLVKALFKSERANPEACAAQRADLCEQAVDFIQNHWG